ncbi:MAG: alpha/beta hydrolase [Myxococcales bacterium]|nr:alpha/beta hydrolase [Myxococcales bacterium]MCB9708095.1 alpha/beta hydrolase [Myxococcales bacterium]
MGLAGFIARTCFGWQRSLIFPRHLAREKGDDQGINPLAERWWLSTEEGDVEAWFIPSMTQLPGPRGAVIFTHGNAERIEQWPERLQCYLDRGMSVLLPEYRGYGQSCGTPSEEKIVGDMLRFWDRLIAQPGIDPARVVLHGRSLGGGIACAMARKRAPAAMVLQSTFTSICAVAKKYGAPRSLILDPFDNLACVAALDRPVLIVHGTRDRLIPVSHAHRLYQVARRGKLLLYDGDHNSCPPNWEEYAVELEIFLRECHVL